MSTRTLLAILAVIAVLLMVGIAKAAGAQTVDVQVEPDVTVVEPVHLVPVPPVTCTDGTFTFTAGVGAQDFVRILIADELFDDVSCTLPFEVTAGGYHVGDSVWNGHTADRPTLWVCQALWPDLDNQRHCVRVAACESGALLTGMTVVSSSNDHGRWQMNGRYTAARLAAIGEPDGDVYDLWTNARMARHVFDSWGQTWRAWSCAKRVGA